MSVENVCTLDVNTLRNWLEKGKPVTILDVRPLAEWQEWSIPGSKHQDVYEKLKAGDAEALSAVNLPAAIPVVTVCASGRMSLVAAEQLQHKNREVYSLEGGMKAWSLAWNTAPVSTTLSGVSIVQIRRTGKGCLSYLVASAGQALVIDASLDESVYINLAERLQCQIRYVLDTHLHADHLSRSRTLSEKTGARLLLPQNERFQFDYEPVMVQTAISLGATTLKAIATPGHTLGSYSYLLGDQVLFTGDTLFVDGIGRPDLKAGSEEIRTKASLLYQSIHKLLALPASIRVLPGHTSKPPAFDEAPISTTIGELAGKLTWMQIVEEDFTKHILSKISPTPPNYFLIIERNRHGDLTGVNAIDVEAGANRCAIS